MQTKKKAPIVVTFAGLPERRGEKKPPRKSPVDTVGRKPVAKLTENRAVKPRASRRKVVPETTVEFTFCKPRRVPKPSPAPKRPAQKPSSASQRPAPKPYPAPQKSALETYAELVAIFAACRQACNENRVKKLRVGGEAVYDPKTGFCKLQKLEKFSRKDKLPKLPKLAKLPKAPKAKKVKFKKVKK